MKKIVPYILVLVLVISTGLIDWKHVSAESVQDAQDKINKYEKEQSNLKDKQDDISGETKETEEKIDENLDKQDTVMAEIEAIDQKLSNTKSLIQTKENEIAATNEKIDQLKKKVEELKKEIEETKEEIAELQESIKKREALLKDRLRAIQKNGGNMKYIEVILGSESFADFISRSSAVSTIMDQDETIMDKLSAEKKELEEKKQEVEDKKEEVEANKEEVESKKAALENQKSELVSLKTQLDDQMAEKETLQGKLEEEQQHLEEHKVSLEDEQEILRKQEAAAQKAKQLAQQELEQLAREAAEREKDNQGSDSGNNHETTTPSGNALFSKPVSSCYTSPYGMRWGKLHAGIDLRASIGTSVSAAASGVVIQTNTESDGRMNGYGNVILISHFIDGVSYTTLYAHLSSIAVSEGQEISRGQVIGASGNTGGNYAPHLHFEVHKGGWNGAKSNSVNPLGSDYLGSVNYCY